MKTIKLFCGRKVLVDDDDYASLSQYKWHLNSGTYAATTGEVMMHRLIMNAPAGMEVDHINGNALDNRRSNLRLCSHRENLWNQKVKSNSKTGVKGVQFEAKQNLFRASIVVFGKRIRLGRFRTINDAKRAYDEAAVKFFGSFARP